jgi:hypothetical protein
MSESAKDLRKTYVVDKAFQYKFIVILIAVLTVFAVVFMMGLWLQFRTLPTFIATEMRVDSTSLTDTLSDFYVNVAFVAIGAYALTVALCFGLGLILSNRAAGPMYRLVNFLKTNAGQKEISPLKFRDDDDFLQVAKSVNEFLDSQSLLKK